MLDMYSGICFGDAAVTAGNVAEFDFSSTNGGNVLIISCEQGGMMRVNVDGDDPQATFTTLDSGDFMVFCDGGNIPIRFPDRTDSSKFITNVKIRPVSNVVNLGVTLCRDL